MPPSCPTGSFSCLLRGETEALSAAREPSWEHRHSPAHQGRRRRLSLDFQVRAHRLATQRASSQAVLTRLKPSLALTTSPLRC